LDLWGPERFFSVFRVAKYTYPLVGRTRKRLDTLTPPEYNIDERNEAFTIHDLSNRDSVIIRDGNKKVKIVNYNIWLPLVMHSCYRVR
jgi:hypothetical protein